MEAKDTVMTGEEMSQEIQRKAKKWSIVNPKFIEDIANITANKQAENSFKVGIKEGYEQGSEEEYKRWVKYAGMAGLALEQPQQLKRIIPQIKGHEHQAGIKEAVEWFGMPQFIQEVWGEDDWGIPHVQRWCVADDYIEKIAKERGELAYYHIEKKIPYKEWRAFLKEKGID